MPTRKPRLGRGSQKMLSGKDQHLACIKAKGTFDTRNAVTDSELDGGRLAYG